LFNQDPLEFGFTHAGKRFTQEDRRPVVVRFDPFAFCFDTDEARATAHKKARAWLDGQKPEKKEPRLWPHFAKTVGSDRLSRELFDLITTDRRTVELLEKAAAD